MFALFSALVLLSAALPADCASFVLRRSLLAGAYPSGICTDGAAGICVTVQLHELILTIWLHLLLKIDSFHHERMNFASTR
jgi:hypothetical protein